MVKAKSKATVMVADSTGGMAQVQDRRFEGGEWPIRFEVPKEQADTWLRYFSAECGRRGWNLTSFGQLEAKENSGSITVNSGGDGNPQLAVVWARKRGGPIKVQARSAGSAEFPLTLARQLFQHVEERSRARATERFYFRGQLQYQGLPWRGELLLSDTLRLGPPSEQDEVALLGTQVLLVDAQVDGIDRPDAASVFGVLAREVSVFLSVVMRRAVQIPRTGSRVWTWGVGPAGEVECSVRNLGYLEQDSPAEMPAVGSAPPVPLVSIQRPDFSYNAIYAGDTENRLPADIIDLWLSFESLPSDQRRQFLQVGNLWQLAMSLRHEYQTTRFALMVAAFEALKPPDPRYDGHNIHHVAEALLGKSIAELLRKDWIRAQNVRSEHLHRGQLHGSEFAQHAMMPSFQDPTFDEAGRALTQLTPAAIIEWLRRRGTFSMPPIKRRREKAGAKRNPRGRKP